MLSALASAAGTEPNEETPPVPPPQMTKEDDGGEAGTGPIRILQSHAVFRATVKPILLKTKKSGKDSMDASTPTSKSTMEDRRARISSAFSPQYTDKASFWNGTFRFESGPSATTKAPTFAALVGSKAEVLKVELANVTIEAAALSADLDGCVNLKSLILSNVYVTGEFQRVFLPSLETFTLRQLGSPGESKGDYQDATKLKSRLFFDKTPSQNWDLVKDVGKLETRVEFALDGVTLLKISPSSEEIVLYVPFCDGILQSVSWTLSTLTLVQCNITTSSIPTNLLYFNVYKVGILEGGNWSTIIRGFTRITAFSAQIPGEILNLSHFPSTLTTLTVIDTELDYENDYRSSILNLAVGYHLGAKVLECIDKIMATVERVAVFGLPDESDANILLQKLLLNTTAHWIVMEEFKRNPNSNFPIQQWVEQYLSGLGIPEGSNNFLITMNRNKLSQFSASGSRSGRELSPYETDYYHYALLGWYKTTTHEAYSAIQKRKLANLNNRA